MSKNGASEETQVTRKPGQQSGSERQAEDAFEAESEEESEVESEELDAEEEEEEGDVRST